jgi:hypothetical protein
MEKILLSGALMALGRLKSRGFDVAKLDRTPQGSRKD